MLIHFLGWNIHHCHVPFVIVTHTQCIYLRIFTVVVWLASGNWPEELEFIGIIPMRKEGTKTADNSDSWALVHSFFELLFTVSDIILETVHKDNSSKQNLPETPLHLTTYLLCEFAWIYCYKTLSLHLRMGWYSNFAAAVYGVHYKLTP